MKATNLRTLAVIGIALTGFLAGATAARAKEARPVNILLMTADNLGYGDTGCYGNKTIKTPNLDRLAAQGVRCTDFYTASPTCTVSRATLLTGRYPQRIGLTDQLRTEENFGVGLRHGERLLPSFLKKRGYATACFGKWNIGFADRSRPTERGFDEFFGHAGGNIDYYTHVYAGRHDLYRGTKPVHVTGYSTDLFADAACQYIQRHARRPFFLYLPFNAPHFPSARNIEPGQPVIWQAPPKYFDRYGYPPDEKDEKKRYQAVVTALDAAIGRVLDRIDSLNLTEKTLVIFYSDNGAFMLKGRGLEVASNKPLREGGVTLYEGGIRVPCLVRWPGKIKPGSICREPLISLDLFVMTLRATGAPLPDDQVIDGRDPTATLAGKAPSPHRSLFFQYRKMSAVRRGRYKLLRPAPNQPFRLYDLAADIGETNDLAPTKPNLVAALEKEFNTWLKEVSE